MKYRAINPGKVAPVGFEWKYSIIYSHSYGANERWSDDSYFTASAAKQAMREKVAQERKKHCV